MWLDDVADAPLIVWVLCVRCVVLFPAVFVLLQKLCVRDPPGRGLVVAHLVVQGHEPCNALDEMLEQAAGQYR